MPDPAACLPPTAGRHLFIYAHPDDDCFTAGLLQRLLRAGADVRAVWVTSGDARGNAAQRETELDRAMALLGLAPAQRRLLRFPNRGLPPRLAELRAFFIDLLQEFRPDCCYVTAWEGGHVDHDLINQTLRSALRASVFDKAAPRVYEFPLYNTTGPRYLLRWRINGFPPGGAQPCGMPLDRAEVALKRRVMRCYASQWRDMLPFMLAMPGRRLRRIGEQYRPLDWRDQAVERPHHGQLNYERGPNGTPFQDVATAVRTLETPAAK